MANDNGEGSSRAQEAQGDAITPAAAPQTTSPAVNESAAPPAQASAAGSEAQPRAQAQQSNSFYAPNPQQIPQQQVNYAQYPNAYGQPFQPYQPPMQPVPMQTYPAQHDYPTPPVETKGWKLYHLIFHGLLVIISVVDLAMSLSLLKYSFWNDPTTVAVSCVGVPVLIILWSGAELITRAFRTDHIGIHPGAHVGCLLVLWLAAAITAGITATVAAYAREDERESNSGRTCWDYPTQSYTEDACETMRNPWTSRGVGVFTGTVAMKCFEWLLTFVLFVQACIDTHKRRRAMRTNRVVYVQAPYWPGPVGQGYMPMQQQQQQQQQMPMGQGYGEKGQSVPMQERAPVHRPSDQVPAPQQPQQVHQGQGQPQVQEYYTPGQAA